MSFSNELKSSVMVANDNLLASSIFISVKIVKENLQMDNRVYQLRKKKGLTLAQLSKKSGIGKTAINNFENGETDK